jgi:leader peptidase (prepilin peptidase)/N-methyltransferase
MPRRRRVRPNYPLLWAIALFLGLIIAYVGLGVLLAQLAPKRMGVPRSLQLSFLALALDATLAVWFFAVGSSIGSFLNVVAYRLPLGKTLGGHSACPYCCTQIAAADNIPVFAWIRLRGRCRTCRLPISIQYPLVELAVGLIFLAVYFIEFGVAGSNLPGSPSRPQGIGLIWMSVTQVLAVRVLLFLFTLSGLIGAALIVLRHSRPPVTLFAWIVLIILVIELALPTATIVPWWSMGRWVSVPNLSRADALLTLAAGGASGLILAVVTLPFFAVASNRIAWTGVLACLGALLGWQAIAVVTTCILASTLLGNALIRMLLGRLGERSALIDPVTWSWFGLFIFRANWKWIDAIWRSLDYSAPWLVLAMMVCASVSLGWLVGRVAWTQSLPVRTASPTQAVPPEAIG